METLKRKLSSRKLWAAIVGVLTGIAMAFGLDESVISTVAGAVLSVMSVMTYIITEGKIDTAAVKDAVDDIKEAVDVIQDAEESVSSGN